MTDLSLGIIYAIKQSGKPWNQAVAEYMSNYSGSPIEDYTETKLNQILKSTFLDYISTCDKPNEDVETLFEMMKAEYHSLGYYIAHTLAMTIVKNDGKYVNGFRSLVKEEET